MNQLLIAIFYVIVGAIITEIIHFVFDKYKSRKIKPIFKYSGYYTDESDNTLMYWEFRVHNNTANSFSIEKVKIQKHLFWFIYIKPNWLVWAPDFHVHDESNPFERNESIKPNRDYSIVVKFNSFEKDIYNYQVFENTNKKLKFKFYTTLKNYTSILNSNWQDYDGRLKFNFKTNK